jgi:hypothetical protein
MSDAETSQKVESEKLELVRAVANLVEPLDQILSMQRSTARRFSLASFLVVLAVVSIALESCRSHGHDIMMDRRVDTMMGRMEALKGNLDSKPTINIKPAPSSDPSASPMLVIKPPLKPTLKPGALKPPPAQTKTVEIPLDLPRKNAKQE